MLDAYMAQRLSARHLLIYVHHIIVALCFDAVIARVRVFSARHEWR